MVQCAIVKLLLLLPFMMAGRLFFIFTIAVVALIRLNDVVSCHETRAWDWLKRVTAVLSGPTFRHTCRVWIMNVQICNCNCSFSFLSWWPGDFFFHFYDSSSGFDQVEWCCFLSWDWLKRVTTVLSGPAFRHTCRVWKMINAKIKWVMTREVIY